MTAAQALRLGAARLAGAGVDEPRRTAELLLASVLEVERVYLIAHPEAALDEAAAQAFDRHIQRRVSREPLQYLLGRQEFYSRDFAVGPGTLIPRPETELLVERALAVALPGARVCDVGTGAGAIAVTIALERPDLRVFATELAPEAIAHARRNARSLNGAVALCLANLLSPFRDGSLDLVVSNPPYVAETARSSLQPELAFEPPSALFAGVDGLDCYRRLVPEAQRVLKPGGRVLLELGHDSLEGVSALLRGEPWSDLEVFEDLGRIPRVIAARRKLKQE